MHHIFVDRNTLSCLHGNSIVKRFYFNKKLFHRLVDYATVYPDGRVVFTFRNGAEVGTEI